MIRLTMGWIHASGGGTRWCCCRSSRASRRHLGYGGTAAVVRRSGWRHGRRSGLILRRWDGLGSFPDCWRGLLRCIVLAGGHSRHTDQEGNKKRVVVHYENFKSKESAKVTGGGKVQGKKKMAGTCACSARRLLPRLFFFRYAIGNFFTLLGFGAHLLVAVPARVILLFLAVAFFGRRIFFCRSHVLKFSADFCKKNGPRIKCPVRCMLAGHSPDGKEQAYFEANTSTGSIFGGSARSSAALAIRAAAIGPDK